MQFLKQTTVKKTSLLLLLMITILIVTPVIALASTSTPSPATGNKIMVADGSDILTDVQNAESTDSVTSLTKSAKTAGNSLITFIRVVGVIVAVLALVFIGYGLWFSPNAKTITEMKVRVGALVLGLIVAFMAEQIVGTVLMWLNVKVGS